MLLKLLGKSLLVSGGRTALSVPVQALTGCMPHMCAGGSEAALCLDSVPSGGGVRGGDVSEQRMSPYHPPHPSPQHSSVWGAACPLEFKFQI